MTLYPPPPPPPHVSTSSSSRSSAACASRRRTVCSPIPPSSRCPTTAALSAPPPPSLPYGRDYDYCYCCRNDDPASHLPSLLCHRCTSRPIGDHILSPCNPDSLSPALLPLCTLKMRGGTIIRHRWSLLWPLAPSLVHCSGSRTHSLTLLASSSFFIGVLESTDEPLPPLPSSPLHSSPHCVFFMHLINLLPLSERASGRPVGGSLLMPRARGGGIPEGRSSLLSVRVPPAQFGHRAPLHSSVPSLPPSIRPICRSLSA